MNDDLETLRRENEALKARLSADRYRIIEPLGSGGFCETFRAADEHDIEVCLKVLKPHLREIPDCVRYFRREAHIGSNLRHSNIVLLIDVDFERYRLVYQLIDGVDLRRLLAHAGGKLNADFVVLVGLGISAALDHAHTRTRQNAPAAVIHRDVTPANILVAHDGQVLLADFGIAAIESTVPQTAVGGTAQYRSPEQVRREPLDARTDLYSLGVVLYELLMGRLPFDDGDGAGDPAELEWSPGIPSALIAVITKLLQPNRDARHKNASEVFLELSELAPSHDVVRVLGAKARAVRRRKTKEELRTRSLSQDVVRALPSPEVLSTAVSATSSNAHEAVTVVRAETGRDHTSTEPLSPIPRRVKPRTLAAVLGATAIVLVAMVWPTSRSRSATAHEVTAPADQRPTLAAAPTRPLAEIAEAAEVASARGATTARPAASLPSAEPSSSIPPASSHFPVAALDPAASDPVAVPAPKPATIKVGADKSARVLIDNRFVGNSPTPPKTVEPGSHTIVIGEGAQKKTSTVQVTAGETKEVYFKIRRAKN